MGIDHKQVIRLYKKVQQALSAGKDTAEGKTFFESAERTAEKLGLSMDEVLANISKGNLPVDFDRFADNETTSMVEESELTLREEVVELREARASLYQRAKDAEQKLKDAEAALVEVNAKLKESEATVKWYKMLVKDVKKMLNSKQQTEEETPAE